MRFTFTVEVEVERLSGKFASRDEVGELLNEALNEANPENLCDLGAESNSEYEVVLWDVSEVVEKKAGRK